MSANIKLQTTNLFFLLLAISLILFGLDKLSYLNWLKRPIEGLVNPLRNRYFLVQKTINNKLVAFNNSADSIILRQKAEYFERENADLQQKLVALQKENESMRKLLGAPLSPSWQFIPGKILNISGGFMTIDQGSDNSVKEGQTVINENVLIGRVVSVNPRQSKIMLVSNKDNKIKAKIVQSKLRGLVRLEAGKLILDEVLQAYNLTKDQIVVTSGEDQLYLPNLIIGKIESIVKNETAVYQQAVINPLINPEDLSEVFIIK